MNAWDVRGNITVAEAVAHSILMFMLYGPDGDEPYTLPSYYTSYYTDASNDSDYSTENDTSQEQEFADLYNSLGNIGYDKLIDSYGSNWSGDHGYIDDDGVGVFPGFAGNYSYNDGYDAIVAYQTEQTLYEMGVTTTSYGLYASAGKGNSLYSSIRNWAYNMHGIYRNAHNSKDGLTPQYSISFEEKEGAIWAPDGREYIYTDMSPNGDKSILIPMNDPKYMGTYNYVVPMDWNALLSTKVFTNPLGWTSTMLEFEARGLGHIVTDVLPYKIWGNVEGVPNE